MTRVSQLKRPDSLSKIAEETIRDSIVRGIFRLGEPLQEAKLSAELGISKTPIREALAALKLQGLVQIFPQRGAFVFTLSQARVVQLCQYRLVLENAALDLSLGSDPKAFLASLSETCRSWPFRAVMPSIPPLAACAHVTKTVSVVMRAR